MAQISNCLKLLSKIDERDQDALVARLDELQAQGVPAERAQIQAAIDVLTAVQGESSESNQAPALASKARAAIKSGVTDTPEFKLWSGGAPVVPLGESHDYRSGEPVVVEALHGTTNSDLTEFKRERANIESDWGAGFYASNSPDDVATNYANNDGADLTQRIELLAERLALNEFDDDIEAAREEAKKRLTQESPNTMKLYVRMSNPAVQGGPGETFFDYTEEYDEETDSYDEPTGKLVDFVESLRSVADEFDDVDVDGAMTKVWDEAAGDGIGLADLVGILKSTDSMAYASNRNGGYNAANEVIRRALEDMGFDGVIDTTVYDKFGPKARRSGQLYDRSGGMKGMDEGTVHFIAFEPAQLKSATGNRGTFDPSDANITRSASRAPTGVEIVEVEDGFDAMKDGKRIGRLRDNLPRGAAEQLDENASVDIVKVDNEFKGQGVGSALYEAFNEKHGGRIAPSGKTSPEAWALWKRKYPEKVDAFVAAEAARIADGADQAMVIRNISDPEVARRVAEAAPETVLRSASRQIDTPEFRAWFGDSKVVDADGKPMVVYHGSTSGGISSATVQNTFFTPNRDVANSYALDESASRSEGQLVVNPVYIRIENPLIVDADGAPWMAIPFEGKRATTDEIAAIAKRRGHDGVLIKNVEDNVNDEELPPADIYITLGKRGQIKSATGNNGSFDATSANITRSATRPEFFSQLQRAIEQVPDRLATMAAPQWKLWLDANASKLGIKKDEIEWSGVKDYLDLRGKDKVTRDELVAYLGDSGVRVQEVVLQDGDWAVYDGEDNQYFGTRAEAVEYANEMGINVTDDTVFRGTNRAGGFGAKYGSYTVPGGERYREVLITLPEREPNFAVDDFIDAMVDKYGPEAIYDIDGNVRTLKQSFPKMLTAEDQAGFDRASAEADADPVISYTSSHWMQKNILAHLRIDDRVDADGARVLFINELQSDFGQDYKRARDAIRDAVDADFTGIVERMKNAGVLEVVCD